MAGITGTKVKDDMGVWTFAKKGLSASFEQEISGDDSNSQSLVKYVKKLKDAINSSDNTLYDKVFSGINNENVFKFATNMKKSGGKFFRTDIYDNGVVEDYVGDKMVDRKNMKKDEIRQLLSELRKIILKENDK